MWLLPGNDSPSDICPHCKKDRRQIREIIQSIRDNYDEITDNGFNNFESDPSNQLILDFTSLSKHPANQFDPIRLDMSKNVLPLLEEYAGLMDDYIEQDQVGYTDEGEDDDLEITRDSLNQIIPKVKKEVSRLLADYTDDFTTLFPLK